MDSMLPSEKILVCIPTLNPGQRFIHLLEKLRPLENAIFIYDDGSTHPILTTSPLKIFRCPKNLGKGMAIKRALALALQDPKIEAILFCDSDGQHDPADIFNLYERANEDPKNVLFGVRNFHSDTKVPFRNRFGNGVMRILFRVFFSSNLQDTQTGLRVIPRHLFEALSKVKSNRFDYEMRQLCFLVTHQIPILQIPIQTLYFEGNPSTFRALKDSFRIIRALLGEFFFQWF